jgi:hypothetical protein
MRWTGGSRGAEEEGGYNGEWVADFFVRNAAPQRLGHRCKPGGVDVHKGGLCAGTVCTGEQLSRIKACRCAREGGSLGQPSVVCAGVPKQGASTAHFFAALDFFGAGAAAAFFAIAKGYCDRRNGR